MSLNKISALSSIAVLSVGLFTSFYNLLDTHPQMVKPDIQANSLVISDLNNQSTQIVTPTEIQSSILSESNIAVEKSEKDEESTSESKVKPTEPAPTKFATTAPTTKNSVSKNPVKIECVSFSTSLSNTQIENSLATNNKIQIIKIDSDGERDDNKKTKNREDRKSQEKEREDDDRKTKSQIVDSNISNQISSPTTSQQITNSAPSQSVSAPSQSDNANNCLPAIQSNNSSQNQAKTTVNTPSSYRDGSYSSTINYTVPKAIETITVTINLVGGNISSVSTQNSAVRGDSKFYQTDFANAIAGQVSNKKIDAVNLSTVGGASLTTDAFMQALQNIKKQAI